jgi:hypothetical protein
MKKNILIPFLFATVLSANECKTALTIAYKYDQNRIAHETSKNYAKTIGALRVVLDKCHNTLTPAQKIEFAKQINSLTIVGESLFKKGK